MTTWPACRSRHIAEQGVVGAEMPRAQERQESQGGEVGHVHMQPSATSLSSLEVSEPIVGPIDMCVRLHTLRRATATHVSQTFSIVQAGDKI